jgi:hypothetical protein
MDFPFDAANTLKEWTQLDNGRLVPLSELIICIAKRVVKKKADCQYELTTVGGAGYSPASQGVKTAW